MQRMYFEPGMMQAMMAAESETVFYPQHLTPPPETNSPHWYSFWPQDYDVPLQYQGSQVRNVLRIKRMILVYSFDKMFLRQLNALLEK